MEIYGLYDGTFGEILRYFTDISKYLENNGTTGT